MPLGRAEVPAINGSMVPSAGTYSRDHVFGLGLVSITNHKEAQPPSMRWPPFSSGRKSMNRRTLPTMTLAFLAVLFATALPQASFAQSNPLVGTWKINLAKSKYTPGPLPKSLTRTTEAVGQSFKTTFEGINGQGTPVKVVFGLEKTCRQPPEY